MPTYNGHPRSAYEYTGSEPEDFERWVRGEIDTLTFQTVTARGEGTASLVAPTDAGSGSSGGLAGGSEATPTGSTESGGSDRKTIGLAVAAIGAIAYFRG